MTKKSQNECNKLNGHYDYLLSELFLTEAPKGHQYFLLSWVHQNLNGSRNLTTPPFRDGLPSVG